MKVLSLAAVNMTITNPTKGQISIGGGGKQVGSVAYQHSQEAYTMQASPDGGAAFSHNASKAGTITISIQQTSEYAALLADFCMFCWNNPANAASTITITDATGNISCVASNCFPRQYPGVTVGGTVGERTFDFLSDNIDPKEHGGNK